jgi:hydroxymethylpyrimidine/phosphomethylpyrimidine kinase
MKDACRIISKKGCSVIVKGGHSDAVDVLYHEKFYELKGRKYAYETHGTGCTFASAITAELAKGKNLLNAVKKAKDFVDLAIKASYKPGKGPRVAFQDINAQKHRVESRLKKVVEKIEKNFYTLIPEVGTNFVYALSWASDPKDVVAIEGRIVKLKNRSKAVGGITFGGSKHVAAIVLTAMKFDSSIRSGINIKYTEHILNACEKAGLKISKFSREKEPKGVKSMEWGTAECIKAFGSVPDVIYDLGAVGKEPMIRILGKNPEDVYKKIKKILKAYSVK